MWSGPRNISTALMRSFENRNDTYVIDEPFYGYYLKETNKNHPLKNEIIKKYPNNEKDIIKMITKSSNSNKLIFYQKHMTHHILEKTPLDWILNGVNCFLIRDPKDVIVSYIKKNELKDSNDLGFKKQIALFNFINKANINPLVINADDLSNHPKKVLFILCKKLNIPFTETMLQWKKGKRQTDGLWEKVWYKNVHNSTNFKKLTKRTTIIPNKFLNIYKECLEIYNEINSYNLLNE